MRAAVAVCVLAGCISAPTPPGPDGVHRTWKQRMNAQQPGPLDAPRMTYDSKRQHVILYGGSTLDDGSSLPTDKMYELDDSGWTLMCDPCTDGVGRSLAGFTYDAIGDRLLLVDGLKGDIHALSNFVDEVWEYDFVKWKSDGPTHGPSARALTQILYDDTRGAFVLVGGYAVSNALSDVWTFDGKTTWKQLDVDQQDGTPGPTLSSGGKTAAYDPDRGRIVVFEDDGQFNSDDAWTLAPTSDPLHPNLWSPVCSDCTHQELGGASLVYVPDYDQTYLIGGLQNNQALKQTWLIEPGTGSKQIDDTNLPARSTAGVAYDSSRDVIVLYGGNSGDNGDCGDDPCEQTWELSRD